MRAVQIAKGIKGVLGLLMISWMNIALAQPPSGGPAGDGNPSGGPAGMRLQNPLGGIDSVAELIEKILEIVVAIGIPIAILFIIYAGFLFVTAQGNEEKLKTAKKTLLWTLVGTAILLGAWLLVDVIEGTVNQFK